MEMERIPGSAPVAQDGVLHLAASVLDHLGDDAHHVERPCDPVHPPTGRDLVVEYID